MTDAEPNDTNRLRAAQLLGQTIGLFKDVIETSSGDRDSTEVASEIERRLAALQSPAIDDTTTDNLH